MKFGKITMFLTAATLAGSMLLTGCGGESNSSSSSNTKDDGNVLVVYNCNTDDWTAPIVKEFQEETGIEVQLVSGGSGELMARVKAEKDNPLGDVMWGGSGDSYLALSPYLEPYESPEKANINPQFVVADNSFYNITMDPYVIAYNTDLVNPGEAPTGWKDLLDPKWKGKIAIADPAKSSSTYAVLLTMMDKLGGDPAIVNQLVKNLDGKIASGSAAQIKSLSDGEYALTATFEEAVMKYIVNGSHMKIVYPSEGTAISTGGIGIIKGAKHMENAKKFIDFAMSKKVHERFAQYQRRSTRTDIPAPSDLKPISEINYVPFDTKHAVEYKDTFLGLWRKAVTQ
ncbi:ABC transporter substrate-binding protein [uncultured Mitsuokella sp.]|uniref:ABC transporter substrate-binding protein n=1 Tax=uncultured Mitsuokella sp. TaxID=453120 RepID=UPI0026DAA00B|nr:ABC transporter substrate-binding protein [uncultured Mitsuokella sp.]